MSTSSAIFTPEVLAQMDEVGSDREAYRIQPGWWVAGRNEQDVREWTRVQAVLKVIHMATNTKVVKIASTSPAEPGVLIDMAAYPDQFILCLNTAEVRKVGLAGVR